MESEKMWNTNLYKSLADGLEKVMKDLQNLQDRYTGHRMFEEGFRMETNARLEKLEKGGCLAVIQSEDKPTVISVMPADVHDQLKKLEERVHALETPTPKIRMTPEAAWKEFAEKHTPCYYKDQINQAWGGICYKSGLKDGRDGK
jgi:hypothetical protein